VTSHLRGDSPEETTCVVVGSTCVVFPIRPMGVRFTCVVNHASTCGVAETPAWCFMGIHMRGESDIHLRGGWITCVVIRAHLRGEDSPAW